MFSCSRILDWRVRTREIQNRFQSCYSFLKQVFFSRLTVPKTKTLFSDAKRLLPYILGHFRCYCNKTTKISHFLRTKVINTSSELSNVTKTRETILGETRMLFKPQPAAIYFLCIYISLVPDIKSSVFSRFLC